MVAVRGPHGAPGACLQPARLPHQPVDPLGIDPKALPLQVFAHPQIAVARKLQHYLLQRRPQLRICQAWSSWPPTAVGLPDGSPVVAAPFQVQHRTGRRQRQLRQQVPSGRDHRPFLLGSEPPFSACFSARRSSSFSRWARPRAASNSRIRSAASGATTWLPKSGQAASPSCSYCSFQHRTRAAESWCSRQSWERRFSPPSSWRTTWSLNSRSKLRLGLETPIGETATKQREWRWNPDCVFHRSPRCVVPRAACASRVCVSV